MSDDPADHDSHEGFGGKIPGASGSPAFCVLGPQPSILPVMIAVPHAGRVYPRSLLREMRHPDSVALKLEDRYVDTLARAIAAETGVGLLIAQAPRAMIDLNRAPEDVDWEMFGREARAKRADLAPSRRARSGLGLIPRRIPGIGELWRHPHEERDLDARIADIHEPYHVQLGGMLKALRDRWGVALLIDLHSMPPLATRPGQAAAEFVIGDRFGTSCHGSLVAAAFAHLAATGRPAAHNRPYAGGYVLERHAHPAAGIHGVQIEIDRSCYLDSRLDRPGKGIDAVVAILSSMTRRLASAVAELARADGDLGWPLAAE